MMSGRTKLNSLGFSLTEMMVVVSITGALGLYVNQSISKLQGSYQQFSDRGDLRQLQVRIGKTLTNKDVCNQIFVNNSANFSIENYNLATIQSPMEFDTNTFDDMGNFSAINNNTVKITENGKYGEWTISKVLFHGGPNGLEELARYSLQEGSGNERTFNVVLKGYFSIEVQKFGNENRMERLDTVPIIISAIIDTSLPSRSRMKECGSGFIEGMGAEVNFCKSLGEGFIANSDGECMVPIYNCEQEGTPQYRNMLNPPHNERDPCTYKSLKLVICELQSRARVGRLTHCY